ncbi:MAG: hypothetical protein NZ959_07405 [Armatimonadetes bacterium]|nr:hypothetical protein [Armatimonadota bacterium]MDW8122235.1 hypothetical protein [Armatimonadota bacterium]
MNRWCRWVQQQMHRLSVNGLPFPLSYLALRHIASCPDCQVLWQREEKLTAWLRQAGQVKWDRSHLWHRLKPRLKQRPVVGQPFWHRVLAVATVATSIVGMGLYFWLRPVPPAQQALSASVRPFVQAMIQHHLTLGSASVADEVIPALTLIGGRQEP